MNDYYGVLSVGNVVSFLKWLGYELLRGGGGNEIIWLARLGQVGDGLEIFEGEAVELWQKYQIVLVIIFENILPHESLNPPRFLRPFKAFVKEDVACPPVDEQKPCCFKPETMIEVFGERSFDLFQRL